jgi:probable HAF family extracellular repeat protein
MQDIGVLPGYVQCRANAINASGWIIGRCMDNKGKSCPFLYVEGKMVDINRLLPKGSGWRVTDVGGINNKGEILGVGLYQGKAGAFVLVPTKPITREQN